MVLNRSSITGEASTHLGKGRLKITAPGINIGSRAGILEGTNKRVSEGKAIPLWMHVSQ